MERIRVLLLFGGESAEHDVSIASARNVFAALDDQKYQVIVSYIDREGKWWLTESVTSLSIENSPMLMPLLGASAVVTSTGERLPVDVIVPILHGPNGEDGSVQGLAQLLHVPIVGPGITGSAVCMDKDVFKRLMRQAGLPVVDYQLYRRGQSLPSFNDLKAALGHPLFVKPANMGSSVGISKATTEDDLRHAIETALKYDDKVVIERAVSGRELECAVLGNESPQASVVGEIRPDGDFYSYDAKYDEDSTSETIIPADLSTDIAKRIRDLAVQAYQVAECRGLARVDFFLDEHNRVFINEINTLPGFTDISMYAKLWAHDDINYSNLLDKLIGLALETKRS